MILQVLRFVCLLGATRVLALPSPPELLLPGNVTTGNPLPLSSSPNLQAAQVGNWPAIPFTREWYRKWGSVEITALFGPDNNTAEYALQITDDLTTLGNDIWLSDHNTQLPGESRTSTANVRLDIVPLAGINGWEALQYTYVVREMIKDYGAANIQGVYWYHGMYRNGTVAPEQGPRAWFSVILQKQSPASLV